MNPTDALAGLRDIHLPTPPGWWPPPPGWWFVALVVLALAVWAAWRFSVRARWQARFARHELRVMLHRYERRGDAQAFATGVSRLLRRFALARWPRERVASLSGAQWIAFLDATGGGFSQAGAAAIAHAPYARPSGDIDARALYAAAYRWVKRNAGRAR
ncbi:MAG: DUF4381 domain-containing protein [Chromatiales bacterium]|nr:DUF4381 domain-containing protein [Chromatiales bacterium]